MAFTKPRDYRRFGTNSHEIADVNSVCRHITATKTSSLNAMCAAATAQTASEANSITPDCDDVSLENQSRAHKACGKLI